MKDGMPNICLPLSFRDSIWKAGTSALDQSLYAPISKRLFNNDLRTRRLLQACDLLKQQYKVSQGKDYFLMYQKLRKQIPFKPIN